MSAAVLLAILVLAGVVVSIVGEATGSAGKTTRRDPFYGVVALVLGVATIVTALVVLI